MGRVLALLILLGLLPAAGQLRERKEKPPDETQGMVDEDEDLISPTEYAFNPIQAEKDLKVGDFYAKKGNHRAAVGRYLEATRWNPNFGEAFWKLGRSREKLDQHREALEAYQKYLEIEPSGKWAADSKKRVADLGRKVEKLPLAQEDLAQKDR